MNTIERLREALSKVPLDIPWTRYEGTIFGRHVDEAADDNIPCRITTGGFDDDVSAELAIAAVNALPALLDVVEAAQSLIPSADVNFHFPIDIERKEALRSALTRLENL